MFVNDVKEKEPLPQSVEVLSHAAARAATFLVFAVTWTATAINAKGITTNGFQSYAFFQSYAVMQTSTRFPFLAVQRNISFFQSYAVTRAATLCALQWGNISLFQSYAFFQSYAVTRAATVITHNDYILCIT